MMRVNLMGPFFLTQAVLPGMLARKSGTIVNVSSLAATNPSRVGGSFYGAVKAGLLNFTRYLNIELENSGVRACCILPGEVDTPTLENRPVVPDADAKGHDADRQGRGGRGAAGHSQPAPVAGGGDNGAAQLQAGPCRTS